MKIAFLFFTLSFISLTPLAAGPQDFEESDQETEESVAHLFHKMQISIPPEMTLSPDNTYVEKESLERLFSSYSVGNTLASNFMGLLHGADAEMKTFEKKSKADFGVPSLTKISNLKS